MKSRESLQMIGKVRGSQSARDIESWRYSWRAELHILRQSIHGVRYLEDGSIPAQCKNGGIEKGSSMQDQ